MKVKQFNGWQWLARKLPKKLLYFCFLQVMAYATQGKYGNTKIFELTGMDAIGRFEDDFGI